MHRENVGGFLLAKVEFLLKYKYNSTFKVEFLLKKGYIGPSFKLVKRLNVIIKYRKTPLLVTGVGPF
jgi:hypothetical protein